MLKKKDIAINVQMKILKQKVDSLEKTQMRLITMNEVLLELIVQLTEKIWGKGE